jgi:hypothetical protein
VDGPKHNAWGSFLSPVAPLISAALGLVALVIASAPATARSPAATPGTVTVSPPYARPGDFITVSLTDPDVAVPTVPVRVYSDVDQAGFNLVLVQATPGKFEGTFQVGEATVPIGGEPGGPPHPVIAATHGSTVGVAYTDPDSPFVIASSVKIDSVQPVIMVDAPAHDLLTANVSEWVVAMVTDSGTGAELSEVLFHIDLNRDGIFGAGTELIGASFDESSLVDGAWRAVAKLPALATDGPVSWYATATDRAGNTGRSDASLDDDGPQDHVYIVDATPPAALTAALGQSFDEETESVVNNVRDALKITFDEPLAPGSAVAHRFLVGKTVPSQARQYAAEPASVWLTVPGISSAPVEVTVLAAAVADLAGSPSEAGKVVPVDRLGPKLAVTVDREVTKDLVTVTATSDEVLAQLPAVLVNGAEASVLEPDGPLRWKGTVAGNALSGEAGGDGVKSVEVTAVDGEANEGRGGQSQPAPGSPAVTARYELDRVVRFPSVTPEESALLPSPNPLITVSYAEEAGEYEGDSYETVTVIMARLDGVDVLASLRHPTSAVWTYQTPQLAPGDHTFTVQARDEAGNIHLPLVVRFSIVRVPPTPRPAATPTPRPTAVPTPTPVVLPTLEPIPVPASTPAAATPSAPALTEADIQQTVTALREQDAEDELQLSLENKRYKYYGCNIPLGSPRGGGGGETVLTGLGLFVFIIWRRRRSNK